MQAISYDRFGGAEVFHRADLPVPAPRAKDVLVAVEARSINLIDIRVRSGMMGPLVNKRFPKVPGADFAGRVRAVGAKVTGFRPGDRVFGAADPFRGGSFAEQIVVPEGQIASLPPGLALGDAAALPIAGLAALLAMRDLGNVASGDRVLIHGATGPVGLMAIQLAKLMGGHVTAVAGGGVDVAREMGADEVYDYRAGQALAKDRLFDVILNASGKMPFAAGKGHLAARGRLIEPSPTIPVFIGSKLANLIRRRKHRVLATVPRRADLALLASHVADGRLKPVIAATYGFEDALAALAQVERGGVIGKIVVLA